MPTNYAANFVRVMLAAHAPVAPVAHAPEPLCVQAAAGQARTVHFDSSLAFTGAGRADMPDGTLLVAWTGTNCVGWFRLRGHVSTDAAWQRIVVPPGGQFIAHEESPRGRRDYVIASDGRATLTVDGRPVGTDSANRDWTDAVVREFIRRMGTDASRRAAAIVQQAGIQGLIEETRRIRGDQVRVQYLAAGFPVVAPPDRARFLRDGSELVDDPFARTSFLAGVPSAWRSDESALRAIYEEAARIEPDDLVEQLLRIIPPPKPVPNALEPVLARLIATLQSSERRATLRTLYQR